MAIGSLMVIERVVTMKVFLLIHVSHGHRNVCNVYNSREGAELALNAAESGISDLDIYSFNDVRKFGSFKIDEYNVKCSCKN